MQKMSLRRIRGVTNEKLHFFTPPHTTQDHMFFQIIQNCFKKIVSMAFLLIGFSLFITGCGLSKDPITSTVDPDLRCKKISDNLSNKEFWDFAYENIPTVTIDEVESGSYNNSYVCIDSVVLYFNQRRIPVLKCAFQYNDGSYTDDTFYIDERYCKYGYKILPDLEEGTCVKLCSYIGNGFVSDFIGIKKLKSKSDLDMTTIKQELKNKKNDIPFFIEETETPQNNPLLQSYIKSGDIYSGDRSKILGKYGYISISKKTLQTVTAEEFIEFAQQQATYSSFYNWVSIICDDGTGILFSGCNMYYPTYGKLDSDGSIIETYGDIIWDFNTESYSYNSH